MAGLVKHYRNTMKGIPQLTNDWGAMINLLDAVLVNGFNHVTILGITKANPTSITATINLGSDHGFIDRQVVRIAGSTNGWDGDYKVLSTDSASILVECLPEQPSASSGTATCFTAPLDFEIAHQTPSGSLQPKRAYRSKDPESLGLILLVHDFCSPGAAKTGAKFAKVGVVSGMSDIDTIVGSQMPFDPANQNANWGWDGTYHGWAKWYYAQSIISSLGDGSYSDVTVPSDKERGFDIVGDTCGFSLLVEHSYSSALYGVVEFHDISYGGKNLLFMASGISLNVQQNQAKYAKSSSGYMTIYANSLSSSTIYTANGLIWNSKFGVHAPEQTGKHLVIGHVGNSTTISIPSADHDTANQGFMQHYITDSEGFIRGVAPFLRVPTRKVSGRHTYTSGKHVSYFDSKRGVQIIGLSLEQK